MEMRKFLFAPLLLLAATLGLILYGGARTAEGMPAHRELEETVDKKELAAEEVSVQWNAYLADWLKTGAGEGLTVEQYIPPYGTAVSNADELMAVASEDGQEGLLRFQVGQDTQSRHFYFALKLYGIDFPRSVTQVRLSGQGGSVAFSEPLVEPRGYAYAPNGDKMEAVCVSMSEENGRLCAEKMAQLKTATGEAGVVMEYEMEDGSVVEIALDEEMSSAMNALACVGAELLSYYYD